MAIMHHKFTLLLVFQWFIQAQDIKSPESCVAIIPASDQESWIPFMWVLTHQIFFTYLRRKIPQYLEALSHVQLLMLSLKCLTKCWLDRFIKTFSSQVGTSGQHWDNAAQNNRDQHFHGGKHYTSDGFKDCITLSKSEKVNPSCFYYFHREEQSPLCHECFIAEQP